MMTSMLEGQFLFELSPDHVLWAQGPWRPAEPHDEWEIAILPFKPSDAISTSFLAPQSVRIVRREELSLEEGSPQLEWTLGTRQAFTNSFTKLQRLIAERLVLKGVPWSFQQATLPQARSFWEKLLHKAPALNHHLALYGAQLKNESVLGASPEWLFRIEAGGKKLKTMAVAGTRWWNQIRDESQEQKDAQEHRVVVEAIVQKLGSLGSVTVGETYWFEIGQLEHLRTNIELTSTEVLDVEKVLKLLHPTPAVGVFPESPVALEWLYELPGHEIRADFAAPWVVKNRRDLRSWALVAIRQLRLREDNVFIPAGCGVVAQSIEEVEWKEIQEKINSVKRVWGL